MPSTVLGFDFGMKRIGVAIGQCISQTASPLPPLKAKDGIPNWQQIENLIKTWGTTTLIVGSPLNDNNQGQHTLYAARKFANRLHARFDLPVHQIDERFTSVEAINFLHNNDAQTTSIDSLAACFILESWLRHETLN